MRICFVVTHMELGGAQKAMFELARSLARRGHRVTCVVMYDKGDWIPVFEARYGLPVIDLGMKSPGRSWRSLWAAPRGLWRLHRLLRRQRVEVVQTFSHFSNLLAIWVAAAAGVPVRVSSQRMALRSIPRWLHRLDRWTVASPLVHRMVAVSRAVREVCVEVQGMPAAKLEVIRNGVDVEAYDAPAPPDLRRSLRVPEDAPLVVTVARLHRVKGHDVLLRAAGEVLRALPETRFLLVGDGPLRTELEALAEEQGIGSRVIFAGGRSDVPALLAVADLVVLPSRSEGMPNVLLEAMAAGRAVVATAVGGSREVVVDGETGLLVRAEDGEALAAAMVRLLGDDGERHRLAAAGRRRAEAEFRDSAQVDRWEGLYRGLLEAAA